MVPQDWLNHVRVGLEKQGLPPSYRARLLAEFEDHIHCLTEELTMNHEQNAQDRLGEASTVARHAAEEYRRSRWVSRHPLMSFGLLPIPLTFLSIFGVLLGLGLILTPLFQSIEMPREVVVVSAHLFAFSVRLLPLMIVGLVLNRLYHNSSLPWHWYMLGMAQALFLGLTMVSTIHYSPNPGESQWILGFLWMPMPTESGWQFPFISTIGWVELAQSSVIVGWGWWLCRREWRRHVTTEQEFLPRV
jgi:hypothetical protein